jgi:hypothetical protein
MCSAGRQDLVPDMLDGLVCMIHELPMDWTVRGESMEHFMLLVKGINVILSLNWL